MINSIITGKVQAEDVVIKSQELALRLKTEIGFEDETIKECKSELLKVADCKYAAIKVPIKLLENGVVDLDFCKVQSNDLSKNLSGCNSAFVFAVTLGIGVDRLLTKLNVTSKSKCFITDGIASAFVESFCDFVDDTLKKDLKTKPRFSVGYGDLKIENQVQVLKALSADKTLGITLNSSYFMTPVKSITAIMGVIEN